MHDELVEKRRWIGEERFLHALSFCTLLPGPEAQQLAIYLGWLLNGTAGGLIAGTLFVIPGYVTLMFLSAIYARWGDTVGIAKLVPVTAKGRAAMPSMEVARPITAKRGTAVFVAPPDIATVWQVSLRFSVAESVGS